MYIFEITNHYPYTITAGKWQVKKEESAGYPEKLGNLIIDVPGKGQIALQDISNVRLDPPTKKKYSILISFQGEEMLYRYDGDGRISAMLSEMGELFIQKRDDLMKRKIPGIDFYPMGENETEKE